MHEGALPDLKELIRKREEISTLINKKEMTVNKARFQKRGIHI